MKACATQLGAGGDFGGLQNAATFRKNVIAGAYARSGYLYRFYLIDNMLALRDE
jgi:hypothetical protein